MKPEKFNPRTHLFNKYKTVFYDAWISRHNEVHSRRYLSIEADFMPASLAVSERPTPVLPHVSLWLITIFIILTLLWSMFGRLDVVVVAAGKVLSEGKTKPIQSVDTQIVHKISVYDGQIVNPGDLLIEFDSSSAEADLIKYEQETTRSRAMVDAYKQLLSRLPSSYGGSDLNNIAVEGNLASNMALTDFTINTKWKEFLSKLNRSKVERSKRIAELNSAVIEEKNLTDKIRLQNVLELDFRQMAKLEAVSRHAWQEQEFKLTELKGELSRNAAHQKELKLSIDEANASLALIASSERAVWHDRFNEAQRDLHVAQAELQRTNYRLKTNFLKAPFKGRVQEILPLATGSVVNAGQQIMTLVPDVDVTEAEVLIENRDIGFIKLYQDAEIKFEAYDYTRFGPAAAKVTYISKDAIKDEKGVLRYTAKLTFTEADRNDKSFSRPLSPGMSMTADIKSGSRNIISYFLSPITKTFQEAARER
jgi:hemolysin D